MAPSRSGDRSHGRVPRRMESLVRRSTFIATSAVLAAVCVLSMLQPSVLPASSSVTPNVGGQLTIVCPTDAIALDPQLETSLAGTRIYASMLETLLLLDEQMRIVPGLASRYQVVSPTRVRFWLRPNVRFHDGTSL